MFLKHWTSVRRRLQGAIWFVKYTVWESGTIIGYFLFRGDGDMIDAWMYILFIKSILFMERTCFYHKLLPCCHDFINANFCAISLASSVLIINFWISLKRYFILLNYHLIVRWKTISIKLQDIIKIKILINWILWI